MALLVDVFAISDFHYDDANGLVFNGTDYAIIADTVLPIVAELATGQSLTQFARIFHRCQVNQTEFGLQLAANPLPELVTNYSRLTRKQ